MGWRIKGEGGWAGDRMFDSNLDNREWILFLLAVLLYNVVIASVSAGISVIIGK